MAKVVRLLLAILLLGITGFCVFGFLATFEPMDRNVLAWRGGYVAVGAATIIGAAMLTWPRRGS